MICKAMELSRGMSNSRLDDRTIEMASLPVERSSDVCARRSDGGGRSEGGFDPLRPAIGRDVGPWVIGGNGRGGLYLWSKDEAALFAACKQTFIGHVRDQLADHRSRTPDHFCQVFMT